MKINELKPGHETDRLVAEAVGIEHEVMGYDVVRYTDVGAALFQPSIDLNAAFVAAEQAGLFSPDGFGCELGQTIGDLWNLRNDCGAWILESDEDNPSMAICKAILKLKERNVRDGEKEEEIN